MILCPICLTGPEEDRLVPSRMCRCTSLWASEPSTKSGLRTWALENRGGRELVMSADGSLAQWANGVELQQIPEEEREEAVRAFLELMPASEVLDA